RRPGGGWSGPESGVPPHGAGPPLHTHDFDEAFYLLQGELVFQVDDALVTKGACEVSFAPRNAAHALANHSDTPARYVLICTPAGFERHWARVAAEAAGVEPRSGRCSRPPRSPSPARRSPHPTERTNPGSRRLRARGPDPAPTRSGRSCLRAASRC